MLNTKNLITALICTMLTACQNQDIERNELEPMTENIQQNLKLIGNSRMYFGHMSVGANVIDGIRDIASETQNSHINIIERGSTDSFPESFFLHSPIGENTKPVSKCIDFKNVIRTELAGKIDYALFKFCYVDFNEDTNVEAVFKDYSNIMDELIANYPDITFIHVTTPLRSIDSGPGVWIREILGRENKSKIKNMQRNRFNKMLRAKYGDRPILDLAAAESTYLDGSRHTFKYKGDTVYYAMIDDYTDDGGHLNELGRRKVASDFIAGIANIIRDKQ